MYTHQIILNVMLRVLKKLFKILNWIKYNSLPKLDNVY